VAIEPASIAQVEAFDDSKEAVIGPSFKKNPRLLVPRMHWRILPWRWLEIRTISNRQLVSHSPRKNWQLLTVDWIPLFKKLVV
jgi:hypothetical protein